MLSTQELAVLNHRGFLPMQGEEEPAFLERIAVLEKDHMLKSPIDVQDAFSRCEKLFDLHPDWVAIEEKQKGLAPWQGAVLWIQEDVQGNRVPLIQLSPRLKTSWLGGWYAHDEVLAHECIHAVRLPLNSLRFEEIAAYQTSKNAMRRFLGPIIRRPFEIYVLLGAVMMGWIGMFWYAVSFFLWIPWMVCLFGVVRLVMTQFVFKRCQAKLKTLLQDKNQALALTIRLTDEEISFFSRTSPKEILSYICSAKEQQLRWRMLCAVYTETT